MDGKITHEEFVIRAIEMLREPPYSGIHSVYSGFNEAFRAYFYEDPIEATKRLASKGIIEARPARGGVILYLPGEAPPRSNGQGALEKIIGKLSSAETDGGQNKGCVNGCVAGTPSGSPPECVVVVALSVYFRDK